MRRAVQIAVLGMAIWRVALLLEDRRVVVVRVPIAVPALVPASAPQVPDLAPPIAPPGSDVAIDPDFISE